MRKLISIFRNDKEELRFYQCTNKLSAVITSLDGKQYINGYDSVRKDVSTFIQLGGEQQIMDILMFNGYKVPFERKKNGKIVIYPINKQRRVIWSNNDYGEWCEAMQGEITEDEINPETYYWECERNFGEERTNLKKEVDGYIIAFGNLGLWNGRVNGAKLVGENVSDILSSMNSCDYGTFYCDQYNVRFDGVHHDGRNRVLYRIAKDKEHAEWLVNKIAYGGMTEEQFRRATKSLRPYVAKVYGF